MSTHHTSDTPCSVPGAPQTPIASHTFQPSQSVMVDNIEQVLARGEKVSTLVDKTDDLQAQAAAFQQKAGGAG